MELGRKLILRLNRIENIVLEMNQKLDRNLETDKLITVDEAATILRKSGTWVRKIIKENKLPAQKTGRRYMLSLFEVRRLAGIPGFEKKVNF